MSWVQPLRMHKSFYLVRTTPQILEYISWIIKRLIICIIQTKQEMWWLAGATSGPEGINCYILQTLKHKDDTCCTTEAMAAYCGF